MAKIDQPGQEGYFTDKIWCSVTYDANGGIVDREKDSVVCGDNIQELATPTKEGAVFSGWYHNGVEVKVGDTLTGRITVTAEWKTLSCPEGTYLTPQGECKEPITVTFKTLTGGYFPNSFIMP